VAALVVRVTDECGFEEADEVGFVDGGQSEGGSSSSGRTTRQNVRESEGMPSSAPTRRIGMSLHGGGWQPRGQVAGRSAQIHVERLKKHLTYLGSSHTLSTHRPFEHRSC
jgi:hypothetical protein